MAYSGLQITTSMGRSRTSKLFLDLDTIFTTPSVVLLLALWTRSTALACLLLDTTSTTLACLLLDTTSTALAHLFACWVPLTFLAPSMVLCKTPLPPISSCLPSSSRRRWFVSRLFSKRSRFPRLLYRRQVFTLRANPKQSCRTPASLNKWCLCLWRTNRLFLYLSFHRRWFLTHLNQVFRSLALHRRQTFPLLLNPKRSSRNNPIHFPLPAPPIKGSPHKISRNQMSSIFHFPNQLVLLQGTPKLP